MKISRQKLAGAFLMLLFCLMLVHPLSARAENTRIQCGDNVYATLDAAGTLTISGTGDMWSCKGTYYLYGIEEDIYKVVIQNGVTSIGDYAFCGLKNLQSVSIGSTVTKIGEEAFNLCQGLYSIDIPGNVQTIGEGVFSYSSLKTCTLHQGLKTIGERAFYASSLTSIVIPEGISTIEQEAFACSYLTNVTIPKDIVIIKAKAFDSVNAVIYSTDVTLGEGCFGSGSVLTADRGSTADVYAKNHGLTIKYFQYSSKVTFNANGGSVKTKSKQVLTETYYGSLPSPARKKYQFTGWYTQKSGGSKVTSETMVTSRTDSTLYAHWKKITVGKCAKPSVKNSSSKKAVVKVKKVSGAQGYQIRYSLKSSMKSAKTVLSKSTSKTVSGLKKGKTYYVQVRAYKIDSSGSKVYGAWSSKQKVKIKK